MGRTHRHEKDEGEIVNFRSKRKGKQSRKERKSKASLSNNVSFRSQRHVPHQPNAETIKAMEETDAILQAENGTLRTFDTVEEMLERTEAEWGSWTIVEATNRWWCRAKVFNTIIEVLSDRLEKEGKLPPEPVEETQSAPAQAAAAQ